MNKKLTHFNPAGQAIMVNVGEKKTTFRMAKATGFIQVPPSVMEAIQAGGSAKGDILGVARLAGIMAAKKTADLIPLCHPLGLDASSIKFRNEPESGKVHVECRVEVHGRTGVEMEALTGATVALLTIYDMTKAMDKGMCIGGIRLLEKKGGKSGHFQVEEDGA